MPAHRFAQAAIVLCTTIAAQPGFADELKPFQASYEWIWHGVTVAVSTVKLERQGENWVYRSNSSPRGIGLVFSERPRMESVLRVTDAGAQPLSYKASDGTASTKRGADLVFDWEHQRVTGVYEDAQVDMPTQPGIQDDLSIQVALMVDLLRGTTPDTFQLVDKNQVREYRYLKEGTETVSTPLGRIETIIYKAQKQGSPRVTRFWCAPARGYIPLRVEQKRGDEVQWTMQIQSLERH